MPRFRDGCTQTSQPTNQACFVVPTNPPRDLPYQTYHEPKTRLKYTTYIFTGLLFRINYHISSILGMGIDFSIAYRLDCVNCAKGSPRHTYASERLADCAVKTYFWHSWWISGKFVILKNFSANIIFDLFSARVFHPSPKGLILWPAKLSKKLRVRRKRERKNHYFVLKAVQQVICPVTIVSHNREDSLVWCTRKDTTLFCS